MRKLLSELAAWLEFVNFRTSFYGMDTLVGLEPIPNRERQEFALTAQLERRLVRRMVWSNFSASMISL